MDRYSSALALIVLSLTYWFTIVVYRLFFHPLAHIPGPRLAIATYLYEWYYDVVHHGSYTYRLRALHDTYGPIIRINPDEVHIREPDFSEEVFNQTNGPADKPKNLAEVFGPYPAIIGTPGHELHRLRRSAVNPFFSRSAVFELVPATMRSLDLLCKRLKEASSTGQTLNMRYVFAAVTLDVMNDYCFAREPVNVLKDDFGRKAFDDVDDFLALSFVNLHIPWLLRPTFFLLESIFKVLVPKLADTTDFRMDLSRQVEAIRNDEDQSQKTASHRTVFYELLNSGKLPPKELVRDRIRVEAFSLVTAGSGTTAMILRATAYHISANPEIRNRLYEELREVIPCRDGKLSLSRLESVAYLNAVINEWLRLADPVTHRIGRQFREKAFHHRASGMTIPAGTTIHMTLFFTHHDPDIFSDPLQFKPERCLGADGKRLEKYLNTFGRGTRSCLGMNLARAELFIILTTIYRRFDFDVSEVDRRRDIDHTRNQITGAQALDSPGILVKVIKAE